MKYINVHLEANFMSFGDRSTIFSGYRDTSLEPTKSMIVGLIACSMGISKTETEKLQDLDDALDVQVDHFPACTSIPAKHRDYQNAHLWGVKYSQDAINVQRRKEYIIGGIYDVKVGCKDESFLKLIHYHLRHPIWPVYAGRKCCPFAKPLVSNNYEESVVE